MDDDIQKIANAGIGLAQAIVKLEASPLQKDYVPPYIQALARELLKNAKPYLDTLP